MSAQEATGSAPIQYANPIEGVIRRVTAILTNWGVSEGCSSIYAVLLASPYPLTAEEIAERAHYAYSSTINHLNTLIRMGLVTRVRRIGKNLYMANMSFVELIKAERAKLTRYLRQLRDELDGAKDLDHLRAKVDHALLYLRGLEKASDDIPEA
ncbi:MAG: helix-turn-helix domain-containing protein [Methanomicrobia archaeon]|nr:helix-turn-helix domain-containing protein [Methanomicrobia archaeon]